MEQEKILEMEKKKILQKSGKIGQSEKVGTTIKNYIVLLAARIITKGPFTLSEKLCVCICE